MSILDLHNIDDVDADLPAELAKARGDLVETDDETPEPTPAVKKEVLVEEPTPVEAEEDDLDEETEEEQLEREAEEAEAAKKQRIRIPKARFDEETAKRKKVEAELEQLRAQMAAQQRKQADEAPKGPALSDIEAALEELEEKYEDAVINGEKEEARKLRTEIRQSRALVMDTRVSAKAEEARAAALEQVSFDAFLARTNEAYPELDRDSDAYDAEIEGDVLDIAEAYLAKGKSRVEAVGKAVQLVLGKAAAKAAPAAPPTVKKNLARALDTAAKAEQVKQPPSLKQAGDSGDKQPSVASLPEGDFNKLSEADLRAARGDTME